MKKVTALVLVWLVMLSFAGCSRSTGGKEQENETTSNKWGITLEVENVTPKGLTIVCHQFGGENVADLMTGSFYGLQRWEDAGWVDVDYLPQEYDVAWTSEAWPIRIGDTTKWDINWAWLYGQLPAGKYRVVKPITNFRGTGDYDSEPAYAEFMIE